MESLIIFLLLILIVLAVKLVITIGKPFHASHSKLDNLNYRSAMELKKKFHQLNRLSTQIKL